MKLLTRLLTRLYQYSTVIIAVGAPLFFIPKTSLSADNTYYIAMTILIAVALLSYVLVAIFTKTWHSVSRLEFISYFAFSLAVIASVLFSKNAQITFFGEAFNSLSGAALLSLPVVMYLTRTLPEAIRHKLKLVMVGLLAISSFVFVCTLIIGGAFLTFTKTFFAGFSNSLSFAVYIGLFSVCAFFYVAKASIKKRYKAIVVVMACLFIAWAFTISAQNSVRPNFTSSLKVGTNVLLTSGIFGNGAGNFSRAWQVNKPQDVIDSSYFAADFAYGSDTMTTLFVTTGIVGLIAFLMLVLSALYSTFVSYRQVKEGQDHFILGLLAFTLLYFVGIAFVVPLSFAMLVMWMVVAGLGLAKARLTEFHPSKKLSYLFIPIAVLLAVNAIVTFNKARAFSTYSASQKAASIDDATSLITQAIKAYNYDGFYRALVEYDITSNRNLVASTGVDPAELNNSYLKKAQAAVDAALAAVKIDPTNYQNYVSLGRAYELALPFDKEGGFNNAKKSYLQAVSLYPQNPSLYVMLARLENSAGTKEGVRDYLSQALKKKQNFADALYLMSQLNASENKNDEAITYAVAALTNAPNDPAVYIQAGLLFYAKKDYPRAVLALKTGLEKDPNNANIAYFLSLALRDGGRPDLAKPLAEELLRRNPGDADLEKLVASLQSKALSAPAKTTTKTPVTRKK